MNCSSIDLACSRFENSLSESKTLDYISESIEQNGPLDRQTSKSLFVELAICDLERRWRAWSLKNLSSTGPQQVSEQLAAIPGTQDYVHLATASDVPMSSEDVQLLTQMELCARCKYGDVPHPNEPGLELSALPSAFNMRRTSLSLHANGSTVFQSKFWGTLLVGRQGDGDHPFPACEFIRNGWQKLICAEYNDQRVSRAQSLNRRQHLETVCCSVLKI